MKTTVVNSRMNRYDVYIGRGSPFGNPYSSKPSQYGTLRVATSHQAVALYKEWLTTSLEIRGWPKPSLEQVKSLRGRRLGCFCTSGPCHGDVLAAIADAE